MKYLILIAILIIFIMWMNAVRRRLAAMNDNINNAMRQIGVQMGSRVEALHKLLALMLENGINEARAIDESIKGCDINAASTPDDVLREEEEINDILMRASAAVEQQPELKTREEYGRCMFAVESYGKMVCTSSMIYNDSVARMNKELHFLPVGLVGGIFGFHRRDLFHFAN